jgi:hypothetical protein
MIESYNVDMSMDLIISNRRILCMEIQTDVTPKQTRPLSPTFPWEEGPKLERT